MKRIAIIGAGELGQQILNLILSIPDLVVVGFFDDSIVTGSEVKSGYKVLGKITDVFTIFEQDIFDFLSNAIGYNHMEMRKKIYNTFAEKIPYATLIHSSCIIDSSAKIGMGAILYPGCILDKNVVVEDNVLLNLNVVVSHDTKIGSHSYISPSVTFSGFVQLAECNFVGTGSIFKDNLTICSNNLIGIGSVVVKNILAPNLYYGNPAKSAVK